MDIYIGRERGEYAYDVHAVEIRGFTHKSPLIMSASCKRTQEMVNTPIMEQTNCFRL